MARTGSTFDLTKTRTVAIATNLSGKEYYAVNYSADNTVAIGADAAKVPFILLTGSNGSVTANIGVIATEGTYLAKIGGNVVAGDKLTSNGNGEWITTVTDKNNYGAIAVYSGASGDIIEVQIAQGMISAT